MAEQALIIHGNHEAHSQWQKRIFIFIFPVAYNKIIISKTVFFKCNSCLFLPPASPVHTNMWQHLDLKPLEHLQNILDIAPKLFYSPSCTGEKFKGEVSQDKGNSSSCRNSAHPCPFWAPWEGTRVALSNPPPESLLAPEGKKLLHKVVSEVQKLFSDRNLKQLKFSTQKIPWVQQCPSPSCHSTWGLFRWMLIIFFFTGSWCDGGDWWQEMNSGDTSLPSPRAPCGICWGHTEVSQALGDAATNNCRIKIFQEVQDNPGGFSCRGYFCMPLYF